MKSFEEFLLEMSTNGELDSTIGKSGAGHNKGIGRGHNTFGDRRGGARKNKHPMSSDMKAGIRVPRLGIMIGMEKRGNKKLDNYLGKVGEPKIRYSKLPSETRP